MSEYATIYQEFELWCDPTDPAGPDKQTPTGRYGYNDGAKMHWFDSYREASKAAQDDGFTPRIHVRKLFA